MPQLANFSIAVLKDVFAHHGIHVLQDYGDEQIMWGNEPPSDQYTGEFHISAAFIPGRWDIFTVRGILSKLGKDAQTAKQIENELFARMNEGLQ